jgi:hypothetical protein
MFIVAEVGVFWVWENRHMWSIRLTSDARMGILWMGLGAGGKAAFMLAREVSVRVDMVFKGPGVIAFGNNNVNWKEGYYL